jgi:uracil-DNA glycosylase family 4
MLVGEQPGDREDIEGEPFVGPAGGVLAKALESAGIDAEAVYLTNAVKRFKWRARGKRRLHQTPRAGEIEACKPWLEAELKAVQPTGLLALGATAGNALAGLVDDLRLLAESAAKQR